MHNVNAMSMLAFVTAVGAIAGAVAMSAGRRVQIAAFVAVAVAAYLFGVCRGVMDALGCAMELIEKHEERAEGSAGKEGEE